MQLNNKNLIEYNTSIYLLHSLNDIKTLKYDHESLKYGSWDKH